MPELIQALENTDDWVLQTYVASVLGKIGGADATKALINALNDSSGAVRSEAARALDDIGGEEVTTALITLLKQRDEDWGTREAAIISLGKLLKKEDASQVNVLAESLKDSCIEVREAAAQALGEIGSPYATHQLIEALADEIPIIGLEAEMALAKIGEPAKDHLVAAMSHEDGKTRAGATAALSRIGKGLESIFQQLINALNDDNPHVRAASILALEHIDDTRVIDLIANSLSDENEYVRRTATGALERRKGKIHKP